MSYAVKEIYKTLQGEGVNAGRAAVFIRFAGCNLWSGREEDRARAVCQFCDTDFVGTDGPGGGTFESAGDLAAAAAAHWPEGAPGAMAVLTGGEPALQVDEALIAELHGAGFEIAIETNGVRPLPPGLDWVTVSPKAGTQFAVESGDELKLIHPQSGAPPEAYAGLAFRHFVLQPMDGPSRESNTKSAMEYCLENPQWRLGLQTHKILGLP